MTNIVELNVSRTQAPLPNTLQKTGALISQGGTTLSAGTTALLTELGDLTALLSAPKAITSMALSTGIVTVTTTAPHGYPAAAVMPLKIADVTPDAFNGTVLATIASTTTFTYALAGSPGAVTVQGTVTNPELTQMATTFFAQGSGQAVYVLELGAGTAAQGVTAWSAYEVLHPNFFYANLVPRLWAAEATFVALVANYNADTAKKYFHVTVALGNYASFTALDKCCLLMLESATKSATEFTAAARLWTTLNYDPNVSNQVTPLAFSFQVGVTPYAPTPPQQVTFAAANVDYITTAAEGGLANTMLALGVTADGRDFTYWYSVDWNQINIDLNVANEVINGSNNPQAPLYYNQQGIDRLQGRVRKVATSAISFGLALGNVIATQLTGLEFAKAVKRGDFAGQYVVNAVPFTSYTSLNPGDYAIGEYDGLAAAFVPARGFKHIIINLNVTDFVAA